MKKLFPIQRPISGTITIPGDKSISHRAVILGALSKGTTNISNFLSSDDCLRTVNAFKSLGVNIQQHNETSLTISGMDLQLQEPMKPLNFGNSGTTARLMLGVLAGQRFHTSVFGDNYLSTRPMNRVVEPLKEMGTKIDGRNKGGNLPLSIRGGSLSGINYHLPVKSAQVKSAILLAGLFASSETTVIEDVQTRDHTENLLQAFGSNLQVRNNKITLKNNKLYGTDIKIPGDISSAAFFIVAAAIVPDSKLTIKQVGLNMTRTGIIDVMQEMGANIKIFNKDNINGEDIGDLTITYQSLKGTTIKGEIIPRLIDEIPIIALLATQAEGKTVIKNAEELRIKETDRITATVETLKRLGAKIDECEDGMIIYGKSELIGTNVSSYHDHRIAMMIFIASLISKGSTEIDESDCISISYPSFLAEFKKLTFAAKGDFYESNN